MTYLIAFLGALLAGGINTLSGNGSAITLTILMELIGLPADVANGTNRVGILANSVGAGYAFNKAGRFKQTAAMNRQMWQITIITTIGAMLGIYLSLIISNAAYKEIFRYLLVLMLVVILVNPKRWLVVPEDQQPLSVWLTVPIFFVLGIYGGFIQMGMGVFFVAVMVLAAHYDIIQANVVKVLVIIAYTLLAVAIFAWRDLIDWRIGLLMAVGQMLGGYLTARFAAVHPKAGLYAYRLLIVVVFAAIAKAFWP
ncbi:sulfite exporter TauE/SafE family protein [Neolewinella aurantiaca]|uniref:Probable membrane transporter protein n=1 Tax=Neolewinella aurantiaca TaxID=2602767 RepID=A0A5C7FVF2_9BACT|nr:sulfite exporter TauE/SafE family protein [Neolewinella aurantiaca]TXF89557.1 sulfite exporter TauE/SafE family protein [Neolewinella aurantiaca]